MFEITLGKFSLTIGEPTPKPQRKRPSENIVRTLPSGVSPKERYEQLIRKLNLDTINAHVPELVQVKPQLPITTIDRLKHLQEHGVWPA
jgi:hypothetical protein